MEHPETGILLLPCSINMYIYSGKDELGQIKKCLIENYTLILKIYYSYFKQYLICMGNPSLKSFPFD